MSAMFKELKRMFIHNDDGIDIPENGQRRSGELRQYQNII